jgi:hypothetical protein
LKLASQNDQTLNNLHRHAPAAISQRSQVQEGLEEGHEEKSSEFS